MKVKTLVTVFFAVYIISLSFIPLIQNTLLAQNSWLGYGTGAYSFQGENYYVLFNDPYDGSSKPHVQLTPVFAPNDRIPLVEFSDWTSYIDGFNFFNDFNATTRVSTFSTQTLEVNYTRPGIFIQKIITVSPNNVTVKIISPKEFTADLELWRWVMTSVNGISINGSSKPMKIPTTTQIDFTFQDPGLQSGGMGKILLSRVPVQIMIYPYEQGFNMIAIDFVNSEMTFTVSGSMKAAGPTFPTLNYTDLPYILPVVAVLVVAIYVLVDKYGKTFKNRSSRVGR